LDREEATLILRHHLDQLEALGHPELSKRVAHDEAFAQNAPSGRAYQLEVSILWDRETGGAIRIIGSIDDGGPAAFIALTDDRLIHPQPKPSAP
jgi:hypothetical protein